VTREAYATSGRNQISTEEDMKDTNLLVIERVVRLNQNPAAVYLAHVRPPSGVLPE
jgi:hypothetical protein